MPRIFFGALDAAPCPSALALPTPSKLEKEPRRLPVRREGGAASSEWSRTGIVQDSGCAAVVPGLGAATLLKRSTRRRPNGTDEATGADDDVSVRVRPEETGATVAEGPP